MTRFALYGILTIVAVSLVSVIVVNSMTGLLTGTYSTSYGGNKLYGGGIKRAMADNPYQFGQAYGDATMVARYQNYLLSNPDKLDCSFDSAFGPDPCMYNQEIGKWCCADYRAP